MRKIWCFENLKIGEDLLTGKLKLFFFIFQMEREREDIRRREKDQMGQWCEATSPPGRGGRVGLTGAKSPLGRGAHGLPHGRQPLSRAPSVLQPVSWASEQRFQIRFWITNHDSLMHDEDYTTLKNG